MTDDEKQRVAEMLKAAWREGFQAARRYPNHSIPLVSVNWDGTSPSIAVQWSHRLPGYIG